MCVWSYRASTLPRRYGQSFLLCLQFFGSKPVPLGEAWCPINSGWGLAHLVGPLEQRTRSELLRQTQCLYSVTTSVWQRAVLFCVGQPLGFTSVQPKGTLPKHSNMMDFPCPVGRLTNVSLRLMTLFKASFWCLVRTNSDLRSALKANDTAQSNDSPDPPVESQVRSNNGTITQKCYLIYSAARLSIPLLRFWAFTWDGSSRPE